MAMSNVEAPSSPLEALGPFTSIFNTVFALSKVKYGTRNRDSGRLNVAEPTNEELNEPENKVPLPPLPNEILYVIAGFLPVADLASLFLTSKRLAELDNEYFWKKRTLAEFGPKLPNAIFTHFDKTWKWIYRSKKVVFPNRKLIKDGSVGSFISAKGRFEGQWLEGHLDGYGILFSYKSGNIIEGEWKKGLGNGFTRVVYKSGDLYAGQWKNGVVEGLGTCFFVQGTIYKGEWKKNHVHGKGTVWFPDGRSYKGEWQNGEKHGEGEYSFPDGHVFKGQWKKNKAIDKGTLICPSAPVQPLSIVWTKEFPCCGASCFTTPTTTTAAAAAAPNAAAVAAAAAAAAVASATSAAAPAAPAISPNGPPPQRPPTLD